jgi:hypothetical protein
MLIHGRAPERLRSAPDMPEILNHEKGTTKEPQETPASALLKVHWIRQARVLTSSQPGGAMLSVVRFILGVVERDESQSQREKSSSYLHKQLWTSKCKKREKNTTRALAFDSTIVEGGSFEIYRRVANDAGKVLGWPSGLVWPWLFAKVVVCYF